MSEPTGATLSPDPDPSPPAPPPAAPAAAARPSPWVPLAAGWIVPGAGHAMLGKVWPAAFIAAAVLALYVGGMALAGWTNVDPVKHRWYFVTHVFAGGPTLAAWLATRGRELTEFRPHLSAGELFTALAGLLNLIAVCDVWTRATRGDPSPEPAEEATGA